MSHFGLARGPTKVTLRLIGPDVMTPRVVPTSRCHVENRMSAMSRCNAFSTFNRMHVTRGAMSRSNARYSLSKLESHALSKLESHALSKL